MQLFNIDYKVLLAVGWYTGCMLWGYKKKTKTMKKTIYNSNLENQQKNYLIYIYYSKLWKPITSCM